MKIQKILIIRFRRVGDAVLSTVLCSTLRRTFPAAQIDYVLNAGIAPLYDNHPDVDNVLCFSERDNANIFRYLARVWQVVRSQDYDVIIDTRSTPRTLWFSLFSLASPYRIGTKKSYNYFFHNYRVNNHANPSENIVTKTLGLLEPLEQEAQINYCHDFRLYVTDEDRARYREVMQAAGIDFSRPVILAAVVTRLAYKAWDKEKMQAVLRRIIDKYHAQIIFNFSADEESLAIDLHNRMNKDPSVFTHIKAGSLKDLCAMLVNCDFFFGNEGGPRHISQALGVPSYAIFPPGVSKMLWLPASGERYWGISPDDFASVEDQRRMTYQQRFDLLTVENVWQGVDHLLGRLLTSAAALGLQPVQDRDNSRNK